MTKKQRLMKIISIFNEIYDAQCSLNYKTPLHLLVATQLAAQCTDARVNIVTKTLFEKYKTVHDFANADLTELQNDIKSTGFYRNKALNIKNACIKIIKDYGGEVPSTLEELLTLDGVGRKTAGVLLGDVFDTPSLVIDTHAKRLAYRMGFTKNTDPYKVEKDLEKIVPYEYRSIFCHQLVYHGRARCKARKPDCEGCEVLECCSRNI